MSNVHKEDSDYDKYCELFIHFSNVVERWLIRVCAGLFLLFLLCQLLLQFPSVRHVVSKVDQLEGVPARIPGS